MKFFDRYDAINPLSLTDSVNLIAPFAQGEILRPEHIVYGANVCFPGDGSLAFKFYCIFTEISRVTQKNALRFCEQRRLKPVVFVFCL